ncbi:alpha/beta hydrolase [Salmonella enterica subsp. enterica]|nr:alpha/beta hydrolase [Salmonella enterica subsp. enterica serovar Denver]ECD5429490.1 alpha/beta hydrolase [Salmonella enterica subsp. enterica serovar Denver]ECE7751931.1 alpha/beta hydrolase [Salmonella enterica subsp. enterica serovar Ngili]EDJ9088440.1 alpha/beta hydrolase [Salmonella enterica subsp. enterica serovar Vitkin]HCM3794378.1 alpha/beta hydrolase [Salmonella enterica subsp. enterica serovar Denver]
MDKHTTWLAYLWAFISGIFAQWTLNDYGALIGIILGIGTFLVNKHYKKKSEQAQARQVAAMEERNRLIARILEQNNHDSTLKMLAVSEMPEGSRDTQDKR